MILAVLCPFEMQIDRPEVNGSSGGRLINVLTQKKLTCSLALIMLIFSLQTKATKNNKYFNFSLQQSLSSYHEEKTKFCVTVFEFLQYLMHSITPKFVRKGGKKFAEFDASKLQKSVDSFKSFHEQKSYQYGAFSKMLADYIWEKLFCTLSEN